MSQSHEAQNSSALNANLVAIIFIISFVLVSALIFSNMPLSSQSPSSGGEESAEVALAETTATPLPSATPLPPTSTLMPTNTPIPSATPTEAPAAVSTPQTIADAGQAANANTAYDPALVEQGATLFAQCAACHGADARGLPNLGKDLVVSEFVAAQTDDTLMQFIITGRPIWDPLNTTGIDMPGKGGNPALTNEQITAIIAYIRSLAAGA